MQKFLKKYKSFLFIIGIIAVVTAAFVPNNFSNKSPKQADIVQYKGASSEIQEYRKSEDKTILWTNSLFSGMPTYVISSLPSSTFIYLLTIPKSPQIWSIIFRYVFFAFICLLAFEVRPWLALVGAIGIGFATENFTILEVGHITKASAISYVPLVLAGCQFLFRKKYLLGIAVLSAGMAMQVVANHIQITYYAGFMVALFFLFQLVRHIKEARIKDYAIAGVLALLGAGIGVGANSLGLLMMNEYAESSIRGQSDLTISKNAKGDGNVTNGLTKDYVFSYSNGWTDIAATFIPNYSGGDSDKTGLYYGQIGSTSGPKYVGATLFILMILGLVLVKGAKKWWLVSVMLLTVVLSMGGNHFVWLNTLMYEHFPLYNKFRAPSMIMVLFQISVGLLATLAVEQLLRNPKLPAEEFKKLKIAGISGLGFIALLVLSGSVINDFSSTPVEDENGQVVYDSDTRYAQNVIQQQGQQPTPQAVNQFKDRLVEMRVEAMQKDGFRSLFFVIAVLLVLWFSTRGKIENKYVILILGLLITLDMWTVGKRYLDSDEFKKVRKNEQPFVAYQADNEIKKDKSYYRVLDLTQSTLNSNRCAYFHKSIGGYSAVKIRRYQDLWDWHLTEDLGQGKVMDNGILNMLNMKYFIYPNQEKRGAEPRYGINPTANGNAWIINNIKVVANADSAILNLDSINTTSQGIVEEEHADRIAKSTSVDSNASISLRSYHPEKLIYDYTSTAESNVGFSEVYYDKGWNAYIDNEPVDYYRLNYILRGMKVPSGKHTITFEYAPETYKTGKTLATTFGGIIYLLLGASLFVWIKKEFIPVTDK